MKRVNGIGIGFRLPISEALFAEAPPELRWLEIHPENYVRRGGKYASALAQAKERWPLVTHGLTMGFGAVEPTEREYMKDLDALLRYVDSPWHSDHLCFAGVDGVALHDLLPLPYDEDTLRTVTLRIREAEAALERPIAVENISWYAQPLSKGAGAKQFDEAEFVLEVLERSNAKLLLDVNNVYVNARNHGFDARAWIDRMPKERVVQIHVAGHLVREDGFRIDTHGEPVPDDVYDLLHYTLRRVGHVPVLLERDGNYPPFAELVAEVKRLDEIYRDAIGEAP